MFDHPDGSGDPHSRHKAVSDDRMGERGWRKKMLDSADPPEDWTETAGGYFADEILQKASRYTKHQVIFENMTASNVAWLDKNEKWSVYVARLMADEAKRRKNSSSA